MSGQTSVPMEFRFLMARSIFIYQRYADTDGLIENYIKKSLNMHE